VSFVKVARTSQLEPGWVIEVRVKGTPYAVCNVGGNIHALAGECPCTGGPLGFGRIQDGQLVCPWHGWRYDHRTGVMEYDDSISIPTFPVKVVGSEIYIDVSKAT
jgi:nitrite reductase/ring-hydroxylating ferredoxin subunit